MKEKDFFKNTNVVKNENIRKNTHNNKTNKKVTKFILYTISIISILSGLIFIFRGFFLQNPSFNTHVENNKIIKFNKESNRLKINNNLGIVDENSITKWGDKINKNYPTLEEFNGNIPILIQGNNKTIIIFLVKDNYYVFKTLPYNAKNIFLYNDQSLSYVIYDSDTQKDKLYGLHKNSNEPVLIYESEKNWNIQSYFFDYKIKHFYILENKDSKKQLIRYSLNKNKTILVSQNDKNNQFSISDKIYNILNTNYIFFTDKVNCKIYDILEKILYEDSCKELGRNSELKVYYQNIENKTKFSQQQNAKILKNDFVTKKEEIFFKNFADLFIPQYFRFITHPIFINTKLIQDINNNSFKTEYINIQLIENNELKELSDNIYEEIEFNDDIEIFLVGGYLFILFRTNQEWYLIYKNIKQQENNQEEQTEWKYFFEEKGIYNDITNIHNVSILIQRLDDKIY